MGHFKEIWLELLDKLEEQGRDNFKALGDTELVELARSLSGPHIPDDPDSVAEMRTAYDAGRVELVVPTNTGFDVAERMWGDRPKELVLRGGRGTLGAVLVTAIGDLTGDSIVRVLDVNQLRCALRTLGEITALGLLDTGEARQLLSTHQSRVATLLAVAWQEEE